MVRRKSKSLVLLATGLLISVSACESEQTETSDEKAPPPVVKEASQTEQAPAPVVGQVRRPKDSQQAVGEQVAQAKRDLAARLNVDNSEITEEAVHIVAWRSGAIGCPKPGMSYTMAIQPGVLILLRVDGGLHRYHASRDGVPFFCPADRAEAPAMGQGEEVM